MRSDESHPTSNAMHLDESPKSSSHSRFSQLRFNKTNARQQSGGEGHASLIQLGEKVVEKFVPDFRSLPPDKRKTAVDDTIDQVEDIIRNNERLDALSGELRGTIQSLEERYEKERRAYSRLNVDFTEVETECRILNRQINDVSTLQRRWEQEASSDLKIRRLESLEIGYKAEILLLQGTVSLDEERRSQQRLRDVVTEIRKQSRLRQKAVIQLADSRFTRISITDGDIEQDDDDDNRTLSSRSPTPDRISDVDATVVADREGSQSPIRNLLDRITSRSPSPENDAMGIVPQSTGNSDMTTIFNVDPHFPPTANTDIIHAATQEYNAARIWWTFLPPGSKVSDADNVLRRGWKLELAEEEEANGRRPELPYPTIPLFRGGPPTTMEFFNDTVKRAAQGLAVAQRNLQITYMAAHALQRDNMELCEIHHAAIDLFTSTRNMPRWVYACRPLTQAVVNQVRAGTYRYYTNPIGGQHLLIPNVPSVNRPAAIRNRMRPYPQPTVITSSDVLAMNSTLAPSSSPSTSTSLTTQSVSWKKGNPTPSKNAPLVDRLAYFHAHPDLFSRRDFGLRVETNGALNVRSFRTSELLRKLGPKGRLPSGESRSEGRLHLLTTIAALLVTPGLYDSLVELYGWTIAGSLNVRFWRFPLDTVNVVSMAHLLSVFGFTSSHAADAHTWALHFLRNIPADQVNVPFSIDRVLYDSATTGLTVPTGMPGETELWPLYQVVPSTQPSSLRAIPTVIPPNTTSMNLTYLDPLPNDILASFTNLGIVLNAEESADSMLANPLLDWSEDFGDFDDRVRF